MNAQLRRHGLVTIGWLALLALGFSGHAAPTISVDGYGFDWVGVAPSFEDPAGDAQDGALDLTNVYTQIDDRGLYFLAQVADPAATLVQFDLEVRVGDRRFLLTAGKYDGTAFVGEVTQGYVPIADAAVSRFAFGEAWEGFVSIDDLPGTGEIAVVDLRVMVGVCCEDGEWVAADRLGGETGGLEYYPVQRVEEAVAYVGPGISWAEAGVQLRSLPGYALDHVWASAFSLPFQIAGLADGSVAIGDRERRRILHVTESGISTLASDVNANWMATLPDGRLIHYSRDGSLMGIDVATGRSTMLADLPGVDGYRSPLAVDALGRVYGIDPGSRALIRMSLGGGLEPASGPLSFDQLWHITDIEIGLDGTVYVGGYSHVVAVAPNGSSRTIVDDLHFEPVFLDLGTDGTLYINELAKGFQAYSPAEGTIRSVDNAHGFQDFVVFDASDAVFYNSIGAYYRMDLETGERTPIVRADGLNAHAFAADREGGLYTATGELAPWGCHLVRLAADGSFEERTDAVYWQISSADVDFEGRLCYIADDNLYRVETDGTISSWPLDLQGSPNLYFASLGASPDGTWVILTRSDDAVRVYRVAVGGQARELTELRFTRNSFQRSIAVLDDARVDVGPDGRITMIVTARGTLQHGPYIQRIYQAAPDGSGLTEIANLDCQRVAGMVDVAVDSDGVVFALAVTGDTGSGDWIFRITPGESPQEVVLIDGGKDPRSIDVGPDGTLWFGTTLGVFRAYPVVED